jgi:hypothetical protein
MGRCGITIAEQHIPQPVGQLHACVRGIHQIPNGLEDGLEVVLFRFASNKKVQPIIAAQAVLDKIVQTSRQASDEHHARESKHRTHSNVSVELSGVQIDSQLSFVAHPSARPLIRSAMSKQDKHNSQRH